MQAKSTQGKARSKGLIKDIGIKVPRIPLEQSFLKKKLLATEIGFQEPRTNNSAQKE